MPFTYAPVLLLTLVNNGMAIGEFKILSYAMYNHDYMLNLIIILENLPIHARYSNMLDAFLCLLCSKLSWLNCTQAYLVVTTANCHCCGGVTPCSCSLLLHSPLQADILYLSLSHGRHHSHISSAGQHKEVIDASPIWNKYATGVLPCSCLAY